jgi:hypothetical protein
MHGTRKAPSQLESLLASERRHCSAKFIQQKNGWSAFTLSRDEILTGHECFVVDGLHALHVQWTGILSFAVNKRNGLPHVEKSFSRTDRSDPGRPRAASIRCAIRLQLTSLLQRDSVASAKIAPLGLDWALGGPWQPCYLSLMRALRDRKCMLSLVKTRHKSFLESTSSVMLGKVARPVGST